MFGKVEVEAGVGSGWVLTDSVVGVSAAEWVVEEQELVLGLGGTVAGAEMPEPVLASDQSGTDAMAVMAVAGAAVVLDSAVEAFVKTVNAGAVLATVTSVAVGPERSRSKGCRTVGIQVAGGLGCSTGSSRPWSLDEHLRRHTKGSVHNPAAPDHLC